MLELQKESIPAVPATGYKRSYYETNTLAMKYVDEFGLDRFYQCNMGVTTSSVSSTTTAETKSLVGNIAGTFTVKANNCVIGRTFRVKARGILTTGITASTITIQLKWGATVIASTGAVAPTVSQSNMYWELEADIIVRTTGGTGTLFVQGAFRVMNAATPAAGVVWPIRGNSADPPAAVTVSTIVDSLIDIQSITGNNLHTITCNMATLEILQ